MTVVSRSLDDLDRLAFRLSRTVRTQYPQLLTQGFTLTDLEERLLPYRDVRREMAHGEPAAFESTLLRLVAGERGYVSTDSELQHACRKALLLPSPSMSLVRTWATSHLRLVAPASTPAAGRPSTTAMPTPTSMDVFPLPSDRTLTAPDAQAATPAVASCRYCDHQLPQRRAVTFCPHCGMDLTKRQCAACSTELEVDWKHCVTCGRKG